MSNDTICIFTGSAASFNIERDTANLGWMLSDDFHLHLLTTTEQTEEIRRYYDVRGTGMRSTRLGEYRLVSRYLTNNDPAVIMNLTLPPIHGNMIRAASVRKNVVCVHRYSGDRFYEYRVTSGKKKAKFFFINNILGYIPVRTADANIAMGPHSYQQLAKRGGREISILPPPINPERFNSKTKTISSGTIVSIGRISDLKGAQTLERAIPKILDQRPDLRFVLAGPIERKLSIEDRYQNRVEITGAVHPEEIPSYLSDADLLVHPSLTEGLPRVTGEALLSGTPVIARDVGDISYVTENIFTTCKEFVRMVINFEQYPTESGKILDRSELQEDYLKFFNKVIQKHN